MFALVKVDGAAAGKQLPWALLQVVEPPKDGVCRCKFFSRHTLGRVAGLRAVLLGTTSGPLRMRLLQEKAERRTRAAATERDGAAPPRRLRRAARPPPLDGLAREGRGHVDNRGRRWSFDKIAFVSVLTGESRCARFPVRDHRRRPRRRRRAGGQRGAGPARVPRPDAAAERPRRLRGAVGDVPRHQRAQRQARAAGRRHRAGQADAGALAQRPRPADRRARRGAEAGRQAVAEGPAGAPAHRRGAAAAQVRRGRAAQDRQGPGEDREGGERPRNAWRG